MVYDNTKFEKAFAAWREANTEPCALDGAYAGDLLDDFCDFLSHTGAMKRSPGRVVFGKALRNAGYEPYRYAGLTHYQGIVLKNPRQRSERRYKVSEDLAEAEVRAREKLQRETARLDNETERKERIRKIQAEMAAENEERARLQEEKDLERYYQSAP